MNAPALESKVYAETDTATAKRVVILVTAIDIETDAGWYVWGFRVGRSSGRGVGAVPPYPRRYLVRVVAS